MGYSKIIAVLNTGNIVNTSCAQRYLKYLYRYSIQHKKGLSKTPYKIVDVSQNRNASYYKGAVPKGKFPFSFSVRIPKHFESFKVLTNIYLYVSVPNLIKEITDYSKTQDICDEGVHIEPFSLGFVRNCFKTQTMYSEAVRIKQYLLKFGPDHIYSHEMCNETIRNITAAFSLSMIASRPKRCVQEQLRQTNGS